MNIRQLGKTLSLGVVNVFASLLGKSVQPAILMYHSFDTTGWKHGVDASELHKQIDYLLKHRTIVPLSHVVEWVKGEQDIPDNAVAITVDDGYADTYTVLFKLAKEKKFQFTLFLTTDLSVMPKLGNLPRPTISQLKEMVDSGLVTIEIHGHSHTNFTDALKKGLLETEVKTAHNFIREHTGRPPQYVAYPAGRYDVNVVRKIKEMQYAAACSTISGVLNRGDDPWLLKRIAVDRATSFILFKLRLGKGYSYYVSILRSLRRFGYFLQKVMRMVGKLLSGRNPLAVSLPQENWDNQFESGYWNFLLDAPANVQYICSVIADRYRDKCPNILDVGCGNGVIPKLLRENKLTFNYAGTDISQVALEQAREHYPDGRFYVATMEQPPQIDETFDIIIFSEVLLYANARKTIEAHRKFMRSDTLIIVSLYRSWRTWLIWYQISRLFTFHSSKVLVDKEWGSGWKVKAGQLRNR